MSFAVEARLVDYECRGVQRRTSNAGKEFRIIRAESSDGRNCEISCTRPELYAAVDALKKGLVYDFPVYCVSGRDRSYISLVSEPVSRPQAGDFFTDLD